MSRSAMRDDQSPTLTLERAEIAASKRRKKSIWRSRKRRNRDLTPKLDLPRKEFRKARATGRICGASPTLILSMLTCWMKQARAEFGKFVRTSKGRPAWCIIDRIHRDRTIRATDARRFRLDR